jgi:hypothetical protein
MLQIVIVVVVVVVVAVAAVYYYTATSTKVVMPTVSLVGYHIVTATANTGSGSTSIDCTAGTTGNSSTSYIELKNNSTATASLSTIYLTYGGISTSTPTVFQYNNPGLSCSVTPGATIYLDVHDLAPAPVNLTAGNGFNAIIRVTAQSSASKLITSNPPTWALYFSGTFS